MEELEAERLSQLEKTKKDLENKEQELQEFSDKQKSLQVELESKLYEERSKLSENLEKEKVCFKIFENF